MRHVCVLLGASVGKACGLPDAASLQDDIVRDLSPKERFDRRSLRPESSACDARISPRTTVDDRADHIAAMLDGPGTLEAAARTCVGQRRDLLATLTSPACASVRRYLCAGVMWTSHAARSSSEPRRQTRASERSTCCRRCTTSLPSTKRGPRTRRTRSCSEHRQAGGSALRWRAGASEATRFK